MKTATPCTEHRHTNARCLLPHFFQESAQAKALQVLSQEGTTTTNTNITTNTNTVASS